jgi:hypothetical protein
MQRHITNLYWQDSYIASRLLKCLTPQITELLGKLENYLNEHEQIDIHTWYGNKFYIVVRDNRIHSYPECALIGFTVEVKADCILWCDDKAYTTAGGNCFTRSLKWKRFLTKNFGNVKETKVHWYSHKR